MQGGRRRQRRSVLMYVTEEVKPFNAADCRPNCFFFFGEEPHTEKPH